MENKIKTQTTLMGVWVPGLAALHQSSVINHCESMWIWQQYMPSFRDENVQCLPKGKLLQLLELSANVLNMPLHTTFHVRTKNTQFTMQTNLRKCWLYMSCKNPAGCSAIALSKGGLTCSAKFYSWLQTARNPFGDSETGQGSALKPQCDRFCFDIKVLHGNM